MFSGERLEDVSLDRVPSLHYSGCLKSIEALVDATTIKQKGLTVCQPKPKRCVKFSTAKRRMHYQAPSSEKSKDMIRVARRSGWKLCSVCQDMLRYTYDDCLAFQPTKSIVSTA